jgi:hypothetical protein
VALLEHQLASSDLFDTMIFLMCRRKPDLTLVNLASQCLQYELRDRPSVTIWFPFWSSEPSKIKLEVTIFILLHFIYLTFMWPLMSSIPF